MKKCLKCGNENIDDAVFCAECGFRLNPVSPESSNKSSDSEISNNSSKSKITNGSSKSKITNGSSKSKNSNKSLDSNNNVPEKKNGLKICFCYLPVALIIVVLAWALIFYGFAESFPTEFGNDFNYLDSNNDGLLSYSEASQMDASIPDSNMSKIFDEADNNGNGYLKGHEFDLFHGDVNRFYKTYSSSSSTDSSSSSNSHSYSSPTHNYVNDLNNQEYDTADGYVLTCPYCGSESVYETGGYYRCAECGNNIYNPDDLELGYNDGYMNLLVPIIKYY